MNTMNNEQALQVIKQILDVAIQRGVFQKIEDSQVALNAFQILSNAVKGSAQIKNINAEQSF